MAMRKFNHLAKIHALTEISNSGWAKLKSGNWVPLANGDYVSWTGAIPYCT